MTDAMFTKNIISDEGLSFRRASAEFYFTTLISCVVNNNCTQCDIACYGRQLEALIHPCRKGEFGGQDDNAHAVLVQSSRRSLPS